MMALYRDKGINPLASLLPVIIQIPLFLALFIVLKSVIKPGEITHLVYPGVRNIAAIRDLIAASSFHPSLLHLIDLAKPSPVLAVLAGIAQYFQTKQIMPKPTPGDAQAAAMSSMTVIFPFLTFFLGLSLPGALSLYWAVASLVAITQQGYFLRQDVREMEDMADTNAAIEAPKGAGKKKGRK